MGHFFFFFSHVLRCAACWWMMQSTTAKGLVELFWKTQEIEEVDGY